MSNVGVDESDTNSTIVTISELIENAFGAPEANTVHHKHIQTVLYILARQLRILERRVAIQLTPYQLQFQKSSGLSVTEVKLHTMTESTKRGSKTSITTSKKRQGPSAKVQRGQQNSKGEKTDLGSSDKTKSPSEETSTVKGSSDKTSSYGQSSDKTSTAGKSSAAGKTLTADDGTSIAGKSSTIEKTSNADKKFVADKTATVEDTSSEKKIAAGKTSITEVNNTLKAGEKSTAGKTTAADDTSTADNTTSAGKIFTAGKTSITNKTSSHNKLSVDRSGKLGTTQRQTASAETITTIDAYQRLLDEVEQMRERELRIIRQRADSRDQRDKTPTPIASLDSFEATYEKLLVVERVPAEEAQSRAARGRATSRESGLRLSVVTQEQFQELASRVRQLQKKLAPIGTPDFPENAELMQELRKGASLTDAMAALQLSARLEATEKTLTNMLSLVTDLASQTPGYKPTAGVADNIEVLFGASEEKGKQVSPGKKSTAVMLSKRQSNKESDVNEVDLTPINSVEIMVPMTLSRSNADSPDSNIKKIDEMITNEELEIALQNVYDNIMKLVIDKTTQSAVSAENAMKTVINLEKKIDVSLNLSNRMNDLENLVSNYSEQINALDTGLSSQLTNYQEELTQMQHDLESGLETMAEVLANTGGDATAVAELNAHFNDLQVDIDDAAQRQKELRNIQSNLSLELDGLRAQIEMLRETKSDRDEVVDALRDKAGLGDLNGLISHQQFDAVRGDIEKRIATAYDKFNNQEIVWQKAIDDLLRELNEKADMIQVASLRDDINHYLEVLRLKIKFISDIVGEPVAAALSKQLSRGAACLSCAAPAHMQTEERTIPILPAMRPPTIGAEAPKPKEDGDHGLCYQGHPVKHPIDPRAHTCTRWCGGSHTLINAPKSRVPPGVTIESPFNRKIGQERGTDGKMYAVDELVPGKLCSQCNIPDPPAASKHEVEPIEDSSNVLPYNFPNTHPHNYAS